MRKVFSFLFFLFVTANVFSQVIGGSYMIRTNDNGFYYEITSKTNGEFRATLTKVKYINNPNVVIPSYIQVGKEQVAVNAISHDVFRGNSTIRTIECGDRMHLPCSHCFRELPNLESLKFHSHALQFYESAVRDCKNLKKIYVHKDIFFGGLANIRDQDGVEIVFF